MLKQLFVLITNIGVTDDLDPKSKHVVHVANQGTIVSFFFGISCFTFLSCFIPFKHLYFPLAAIIGYALTFIANYFRWYGYAKINIWFINSIIFFWMASALGYESNSHLLYLIIVQIALFNHNYQRLGELIMLLSMPLICLILLFVTHFSLFIIPDISANTIHKIGIFIFFLTLFSSLVGVAFFAREVQITTTTLAQSEEEVRKKYIELEKTNKELDKFVYSVSHDLRSPITSMMGLLDLIRLNKNDIDVYLALQEKSLKRLEQFISDILTHSRNSRLAISITAIDFEVLLQNCFEKNYPHDNSKIELVLNLPKHYTFFSDEYRLNIIFDNLIGNAIKYRKPNTDTYIHIDFIFNPQSLIIQVKDNGLGINEKYIHKVFEMFYRAHTQSVGSGLGLYIVKEAIAKLNGEIEVHSVLNEGTVFTIELPILPQPPSNSTNTEANTTTKANLGILTSVS